MISQVRLFGSPMNVPRYIHKAAAICLAASAAFFGPALAAQGSYAKEPKAGFAAKVSGMTSQLFMGEKRDLPFSPFNQWRVVEIKGSRVMRMTENALLPGGHHLATEWVWSWMSRDLCEYINGSILHALADGAQRQIFEAWGQNPDNPLRQSTDGWMAAPESVFDMSFEDALRYFSGGNADAQRLPRPPIGYGSPSASSPPGNL
jgi:hypothetical protein